MGSLTPSRRPGPGAISSILSGAAVTPVTNSQSLRLGLSLVQLGREPESRGGRIPSCCDS
eukprot:405200-Rhodomonas_salina.1